MSYLYLVRCQLLSKIRHHQGKLLPVYESISVLIHLVILRTQSRRAGDFVKICLPHQILEMPLWFHPLHFLSLLSRPSSWEILGNLYCPSHLCLPDSPCPDIENIFHHILILIWRIVACLNFCIWWIETNCLHDATDLGTVHRTIRACSPKLSLHMRTLKIVYHFIKASW